MKQRLVDHLRCPACHAEPMAAQPASERIVEGNVSCSNGHQFAVRRGVLHAMQSTADPDVERQLAENARERRGALTAEEKAAYQQNISRIGCATYNELIRSNAEAALDIIPRRPGASLDIGGGSGWLAAVLAARGYQAVSLDIEDPWDRRAQIDAGAATRDFELVTDMTGNGPDPDVDFVVASMHQMPFRDGSFVLVTMSAALHHAEDPVAALREVARVLQPGGRLLCINEPVKGVFRDERPILHGRGDEAGEHIHSLGRYLKAIRAAGFDRPRLHFPGWVDRRLRTRNWDGVVYYNRLLPLVAGAWSLAPARALAQGPLLPLLIRTFGLTLIADALKR